MPGNGRVLALPNQGWDGPHHYPYYLRLAEIVDEDMGEVVPEYPWTHSIFRPDLGAAAALAIAGAKLGIARDRIVVMPEAETPVYYVRVDGRYVAADRVYDLTASFADNGPWKLIFDRLTGCGHYLRPDRITRVA